MTPSDSTPLNPTRLPLWLKAGFTAFMAVLVPVYWSQYGPTNFLYFCDIALFCTLGAVWLESSLLASMAAVGIILPQLLWCLDFALQLCGIKLLGMTAYMFDPSKPLFLRVLSLFHGWLPFLLLFLVRRLGYQRRALTAWTLTAWSAMGISYLFMPKPGALLANPKAPVNINYVHGLHDSMAQAWMPGRLWLALLFAGLPLLVFLPTHLVLKKRYKACTV